MNKIIHIYSAKTQQHVPSMITNTLIYFSENREQEHLFYLHEFNKYKKGYENLLETYPNLKIKNFNSPKELNLLIQQLGKDDKLILHNFFIPVFWINFLRISSNSLKKIIWVCWGSGAHWLGGFKGFFINNFRKYIFRKLGMIITLMSPDHNEIKKNFRLKNAILLPYYSRIWDFKKNPMFENVIPYSTTGTTIRIKVGNSASGTNLHFDSFKMLQRFKDENIKIITPLSYGAEVTKEKIIETGKAIFEKKFEPFVTHLSQIDYAKFLSEETDILVYNAKTQTGLFNLYFAIYCGKKVYVNGYNYQWLKALNIKVFNVSELEKVSFLDFISPLSDQEIIENRQNLVNGISVEYISPKWNDIFNSKNT